MLKSDAIAFFGNQTKFAAAINRAQSTVSGYPDLLPLEVALIVREITGLPVDFSKYPQAPESLRQ